MELAAAALAVRVRAVGDGLASAGLDDRVIAICVGRLLRVVDLCSTGAACVASCADLALYILVIVLLIILALVAIFIVLEIGHLLVQV